MWWQYADLKILKSRKGIISPWRRLLKFLEFHRQQSVNRLSRKIFRWSGSEETTAYSKSRLWNTCRLNRKSDMRRYISRSNTAVWYLCGKWWKEGAGNLRGKLAREIRTVGQKWKWPFREPVQGDLQGRSGWFWGQDAGYLAGYYGGFGCNSQAQKKYILFPVSVRWQPGNPRPLCTRNFTEVKYWRKEL